MNELAVRRKRLFSHAKFLSAIFYNGDASHPSPSFRYFSGCNVDGAYLVLKKNRGWLITHNMNFRQAKAESAYPVLLSDKKKGAKPILRALLGKGRVGMPQFETNSRLYLVLRGKVGLKLMPADEKVEAVRSRKSKRELAEISKAAKIARKILERLDPWECKTERALALRLKILALEAGTDISFEPIVAAGKNSAMPHHTPGSARLGDFILVDFGVKMPSGYCSDLTRCYFRKGAKTAKEKEAYGKCRRVFGKILAGLQDCKNGRDVARLSERCMKEAGLPPLMHAIGHGIGLEVHEAPHLWKKSKDPLAHAALAIEPAAYFKSFGVRFEETIVSAKKGWKKI